MKPKVSKALSVLSTVESARWEIGRSSGADSLVGQLGYLCFISTKDLEVTKNVKRKLSDIACEKIPAGTTFFVSERVWVAKADGKLDPDHIHEGYYRLQVALPVKFRGFVSEKIGDGRVVESSDLDEDTLLLLGRLALDKSCRSEIVALGRMKSLLNIALTNDSSCVEAVALAIDDIAASDVEWRKACSAFEVLVESATGGAADGGILFLQIYLKSVTALTYCTYTNPLFPFYLWPLGPLVFYQSNSMERHHTNQCGLTVPSHNDRNLATLVGGRVVKGPHWKYQGVNDDKMELGTIVGSNGSTVQVRWDGLSDSLPRSFSLTEMNSEVTLIRDRHGGIIGFPVDCNVDFIITGTEAFDSPETTLLLRENEVPIKTLNQKTIDGVEIWENLPFGQLTLEYLYSTNDEDHMKLNSKLRIFILPNYNPVYHCSSEVSYEEAAYQFLVRTITNADRTVSLPAQVAALSAMGKLCSPKKSQISDRLEYIQSRFLERMVKDDIFRVILSLQDSPSNDLSQTAVAVLSRFAPDVKQFEIFTRLALQTEFKDSIQLTTFLAFTFARLTYSQYRPMIDTHRTPVEINTISFCSERSDGTKFPNGTYAGGTKSELDFDVHFPCSTKLAYKFHELSKLKDPTSDVITITTKERGYVKYGQKELISAVEKKDPIISPYGISQLNVRFSFSNDQKDSSAAAGSGPAVETHGFAVTVFAEFPLFQSSKSVGPGYTAGRIVDEISCPYSSSIWIIFDPEKCSTEDDDELTFYEDRERTVVVKTFSGSSKAWTDFEFAKGSRLYFEFFSKRTSQTGGYLFRAQPRYFTGENTDDVVAQR